MSSQKNPEKKRRRGLASGSVIKRWLTSLKQFLRLGATAILLGMLFILVSLLVEQIEKPSSHLALVALSFLSHIGIAFLILGIIGLMIDLPDWQKYFQERIKETIIEKDFLNSLSQPELMSLTTNSIKAYFKVEDLDEKESFLEYFQSQILGFIAKPYREDTHGIVHLEYSKETNDVFLVDDHTSYKCRKVGRYIQDEVIWSVESEETEGELKDFQITLQVPENFFQSPDFATQYPGLADGKLIIKKDDPMLRETGNDGQGYALSLSDFKEVDGLSVEIKVRYAVKRDRFLNWSMVYPSKGLLFTLHYPSELNIRPYLFGLNRRKIQEDSLPGLYSLRSDSWLLPNDGVVFQLLEDGRKGRAQ